MNWQTFGFIQLYILAGMVWLFITLMIVSTFWGNVVKDYFQAKASFTTPVEIQQPVKRSEPIMFPETFQGN